MRRILVSPLWRGGSKREREAYRFHFPRQSSPGRVQSYTLFPRHPYSTSMERGPPGQLIALKHKHNNCYVWEFGHILPILTRHSHPHTLFLPQVCVGSSFIFWSYNGVTEIVPLSFYRVPLFLGMVNNIGLWFPYSHLESGHWVFSCHIHSKTISTVYNFICLSNHYHNRIALQRLAIWLSNPFKYADLIFQSPDGVGWTWWISPSITVGCQPHISPSYAYVPDPGGRGVCSHLVSCWASMSSQANTWLNGLGNLGLGYIYP